jgi:predicted lipid-binding transport protein (Tim44 family)
LPHFRTKINCGGEESIFAQASNEDQKSRRVWQERYEMVIGVLFSGILAGLMATTGALFFGMPLWFALLLYPIIGVVGALAFIGFALTRGDARSQSELTKFAI